MFSIIVPIHNEKENIPILIDEINKAMKGKEYEIVLVDDGSKEEYKFNRNNSKNINYIRLNIRMGKGEALRRGLIKAKGDTIIFMDGDLQDDPKDILTLIKKLNQGYDLVNGIRKDRSENFFVKLYSYVVNRLVLKNVLHSPFTDINCGFKIFRKDITNNVILYGNNFRFFPLSVWYEGYKVSEVEVNNRKRIYGKTKYGWKKLFVGLQDTLSALFIFKFSEKPLHFFGSIGLFLFSFGFILAVILSIGRLFYNMQLYRRPALWLAILLIIVGIQIIMTGIIGELLVYHHKKTRLKSE